jgi:hypothetical protein
VNFNCLSPFAAWPYAFQPALPALPTLRPARVRLFRVLLSQRPSLHDLLRPSLAFVRPLRWYYAAVRLPAAVHVGLMAHRFLPPFRRLAATDNNRVSRFSRVKFPCMRGVCDSAVPETRSRFRVPPCCLPDDLTPSALLILAISELINFRDTQACIAEAPKGDLRCLFPTLQVRRCRRPRKGRGQDGSLLLSCMTLSFTTSRRFIPTLSRPKAYSTAPGKCSCINVG